jgi:hypothetical protein
MPAPSWRITYPADDRRVEDTFTSRADCYAIVEAMARDGHETAAAVTVAQFRDGQWRWVEDVELKEAAT